MSLPTYGELLQTRDKFIEGDQKINTARRRIERLLFSDEQEHESMQLIRTVAALESRVSFLDEKISKILRILEAKQ
jgi:hypothetical protein